MWDNINAVRRNHVDPVAHLARRLSWYSRAIVLRVARVCRRVNWPGVASLVLLAGSTCLVVLALWGLAHWCVGLFGN